MEAGFINPESPKWAEVLSLVEHDFYHLPGYVDLSARYEGGVPRAFLAEESGNYLLIPLIIRPVEISGRGENLGVFDAISPYGYSCPLVYNEHSLDNMDFLENVVQAFKEEMERKNVVCGFVRFHPLITLPEERFADTGCLVQHGETVSIDLGLPEKEVWRKMRKGHRYDIKKFRKMGFEVQMDSEWEKFDDFIEIYGQTMHRLEASDYYFFPCDYFIQLREVLGNHLHLCTVTLDDKVAGVGLFTEICGIVQYHLAGVHDDFLDNQPSKLMLNFVRCWAKQRGNRVLHLGGGVGGGEDSLFRFKAGFSKLRHPFYTWRVIAIPEIYGELVREWEKATGVDADGMEGFFTAYRKTLA